MCFIGGIRPAFLFVAIFPSSLVLVGFMQCQKFTVPLIVVGPLPMPPDSNTGGKRIGHSPAGLVLPGKQGKALPGSSGKALPKSGSRLLGGPKKK